MGQFVHTFARRGTKGTKNYFADWEIGRIRAFEQGCAVLEWWHYCKNDGGELTGDFVPMPDNQKKPFVELFGSLGPVEVVSGPHHDKDTNEHWVTLDFDAVDKAVQADLAEEEKEDRKANERKRAKEWYGDAPVGKRRKDDVAAGKDEAAGESAKHRKGKAAKTRPRAARIHEADEDGY